MQLLLSLVETLVMLLVETLLVLLLVETLLVLLLVETLLVPPLVNKRRKRRRKKENLKLLLLWKSMSNIKLPLLHSTTRTQLSARLLAPPLVRSATLNSTSNSARFVTTSLSLVFALVKLKES